MKTETPLDIVIAFLTPLFGAISFLDAVDVFWKCVSGLITVGMFVYFIRSHIKKQKLMDIEEQIKQQQLYDLMRANKNK